MTSWPELTKTFCTKFDQIFEGSMDIHEIKFNHTAQKLQEVQEWFNENKLFISLLTDVPLKNIAFKIQEISNENNDMYNNQIMVYAYSLGLVAKTKVQSSLLE